MAVPPSVHEPLVAEPAQRIARIPEAAIQDAWVRGLFDASALRTTTGDEVRVLDRGQLNRDSGPDVFGARIDIGGLLWAGAVEIHTASGDWEAHGHHRDPAYDRVVLHVVLSPDARTGTLRRADGSRLPELVLLPHLDRSLRALLRAFYLHPRSAPQCSARWEEVPASSRRAWILHLGQERLRDRARALGQAYGRRPDLDRLLVGRAFRALGYEANADAFETLAARSDLARLRRLDGPDILQHLWLDSGLAGAVGGAMPATAWRRGGRPANAPRRRIAQAAAWLAPGGPFRHDPVTALADVLRGPMRQAIDWLRPASLEGESRLGTSRATRVWVDAVLPVLVLDAELRDDAELEEALLGFHARLPGGSDRITRHFEDVGLRLRSAAEVQGGHQLVRRYCDDGRCARCAIGRALYPALGRDG